MNTPDGALSPDGISGGHGVGSLVAKRTRTAVAGLNRYAPRAAIAARDAAI